MLSCLPVSDAFEGGAQPNEGGMRGIDPGQTHAWRIEPTLRSYYYVLDDHKVQLPAGVDAGWVTDTVEEVGAAIEAERFEPTPGAKACGWCDFRLACPAAER